MSDVKKPEGFEINTKRAEKLEDANGWKPADAVYDASINLKNTDAVLVLWRERTENGSWFLRFRYAGPPDGAQALMFSALRDLS